MKSKKVTPDKITVSRNYWKVPSADNALDGWIEGNPSEEEKNKAIEEALSKRADWKPSEEAMQLVEQLKAYIGLRVQIQFWHPFMYWSEVEGPYPLEADCKDVVILQDGEFQQAYLVIDSIQEIPMRDGHSSLEYLVSRDEILGKLAPVSELYEIFAL
jgi:hypothetical protein